MNHCGVVSCLNRKGDKRYKFFTFPSDPDRCAQWVEFCHCPEITERFTATGPYGMSKYVICSQHFDPSMVAEVIGRRVTLFPGAVPNRIGKTHMTRKMLLEKGFDLEAEPEALLDPPHIDTVLVEMLEPHEMERESAGDGANFEFIRLKSDDQQFQFENGFKQEFVEPVEVQTSVPKKQCKICSNFKPRYEHEVKKNKRLQNLIEHNKKKLANTTTKLQKMHDRITLRKVRRDELKRKYAELKKQLAKGTLEMQQESITVESDEEEDEGSFDELTAWW
ncbi:uncharacterized protein LOC109419593 [Aedes albopictus]|uniref:THAP-type domain-containing protein n=1 Tax=Aedes albopictus TaxID=7160 RepID=A0ABM1ZCD4_AEDAL